jgi:hypothetical protein
MRNRTQQRCAPLRLHKPGQIVGMEPDTMFRIIESILFDDESPFLMKTASAESAPDEGRSRSKDAQARDR